MIHLFHYDTSLELQRMQTPDLAGRTDSKRDLYVNCLLGASALAMTIYILLHLRSDLPRTNDDLKDFVVIWYRFAIDHGRLNSISGWYTTYTPPFAYFLTTFSLLDGIVQPIVAIKLMQLPLLLMATVLFWSLCRKLGCSRLRSGIGAWLMFVSPDVYTNTLKWGQCDMFQTAWILLMVRLLLAKRPCWAMIAAGIALSFKQQTIFAAPVVLALVLVGEIPWKSILMVPLAYMAMMVPAYIVDSQFGRASIRMLIYGKYVQQSKLDHALVMHANNWYEFVRVRTEASPPFYNAMYATGLLVAMVSTIALFAMLLKRPELLKGWRLVATLAFTYLMEPFLLPKMHDRYFFTGNLLVLLIAMVKVEAALPALILQAAALIAYQPYFDEKVVDASYFFLPALMVLGAIILFARVWLKHAADAPPIRAAPRMVRFT